MRMYMRVFGLTALLVFFSLGGAAGAAKQKVTIALSEMKFTPGKITVQAGNPVEFKLVNRGKVKHEFMVYKPPKAGLAGDELEEWAEENSYFKGIEVKVEGGGIEVVGTNIFEVEIDAGKSAEVSFTPKQTGTFEIGCHIEGHYEKGMKGTLVVR
ncbi:MAG: cupredoxin domain-containing protein [Armatimonadota bacterium]|nr:cupredoxin domain-containing protein [Armatimonadota bacterium]MDR7468570.1 cupredoxin domain-containing protein [Armatimonadota bacterium]MDR7475163.1 cupredoxin domain-containing protein [Armatimonadota bacterium]